MKRPSGSHIAVSILMLLAAVVYWRWLSFDILAKGDWPFMFASTARSYLEMASWSSITNMGSLDLTLWRLPLNVLYGFFGYFGFDKNVFEKFLVFWPTLFVGFFSAFLLVRKFLGSNKAGFLGALVFNLNTYYLASSTHILLYSAAAFALLAFYLYVKATESGHRFFYIGCALCLAITGTYDFRVLYLMVFVLGGYFIFDLWNTRSLAGLKAPSRKFYGSIFLGGLVILLSLFWILTFVKTGSLTDNDVVNRGLFGNTYWNIAAAFNLFHPFWSGHYLEWFLPQIMPPYFWLVSLLAFTGFYLNRKKPIVAFFTVLSLLGVFLTKQVDDPFPTVYPWLHSHFPGFNAFREASKFYFYVALGYSVLIPAAFIGLKRLVEERKLRLRWVFEYIVFGSLVLLLSSNSLPLVTGEIGTLFVQRTVPSEYRVLDDYLEEQKDFFRVLWLPRDAYWVGYDSVHPKLSAASMVEESWRKVFESQELSREKFLKKITYLTQRPIFQDLLNESSVRYIIVPLRDDANDSDFYNDYGNDPAYYQSLLDKLPYLERVPLGMKDVAVYKNTNKPRYLEALSAVTELDPAKNIEGKKEFYSSFFSRNLDYTSIKKEAPAFPTSTLERVFENTDLSSFKGDWRLSAPLTVRNNQGVTVCLVNNREQVCSSQTGNEFSYPERLLPLNILDNPSFEDGPWQPQVGDCHNFDERPQIGMAITTSTLDGGQALALSSTRHTACTKQSFDIQGGRSYVISFDFESKDANEVGFYISYDSVDPETKNNVSFQERISNKNTEWSHFSKIINVPNEATSATLYIYSYGNIKGEEVITKYDNFSLVALPEDALDYWAISSPNRNFIEPVEVGHEILSQTKKLVHIKGATTPFYLSMSESYHPQWRLAFNDRRVGGWFSSWTPVANPHAVPDEHHFELNGFLNGWYVDTEAYCNRAALCTLNADGSYDMEMVIEFVPQRWFYVGLLVSGATLLGCLGYLGYAWARGRGRKGKNPFASAKASANRPTALDKGGKDPSSTSASAALGASLLRDVKVRSTKPKHTDAD